MSQVIGVPRETAAGEKRVATVPEVVEKLIKLGFRVAVQSGAGDAANFTDDAYRAAGARDRRDAAALWAQSPTSSSRCARRRAEEVGLLREGQTLISFIWPAQNPDLMQQLAARKVTVLAIDALPRMLSRAQKMDALTSMAGITGYRAVIEAAHAFGRFLTGQITAAGKVPPAKVFIAGAGVAGLAAIGTAVGLGAIVRANDTRAEVADQVVSLGGEFVKVDYEEEGAGGGGYAKVMSEGFQQAQREMYAKQAREVDIIITTALIPGKPAPRLITARDGAVDEAGQRDRRPGGRAGRQLRADRARQGRGQARRDHHRLHRPAEPPREAVLHALRDQPVPPGRGAVQGQGRRHQRQHGRRRHPRPDGDQGGQHHLAAAAAEAAGAARRSPPPSPRRPRRATATAPARRCRRTALAIMFAVAARCCSGSSAPTRRRPSSATSRCSCSPASSATWWCGTSRPRCTRR